MLARQSTLGNNKFSININSTLQIYVAFFMNNRFILVLIRFANAKLFRTSYAVHEQNNIFAFSFRVGIVCYKKCFIFDGNFI